MKTLHLGRTAADDEIPSLPTNSHSVHVDKFKLASVIKQMNNGAAPGPSGLSMDMLSLLCSNDNCLTGLTWIISDMINGYLRDSTKQYFLSNQLVGIVKPNGQLRPISMNKTFFKLACCYALNTIDETIQLKPKHD